MIPTLFKANETNFYHNGLGVLRDCISCKVKEDRNGIYELELTYPVGSFLFEEIKGQQIVKAKANDRHDPQLFRIYNISKPINGIITVKAEHISYELKDNFVESLSYTGNCVSILNALNERATFKSRFNFNSDLIGNYTVILERRNLLSAIMGQQGSLLQSLGSNAQVERDNFDFSIKSNTGQDKNVLIAYKKNMTGFKLDEDWSKCITKIYPYATKSSDEEGSEDVVVTLTEKYIDSPYINNYPNPKILDVNFTDYFAENEEINETSLRAKASNYFLKTKCDIPVLNYNIEFVALSKTEEYKHLAMVEDIGLFDTVIIRHETYNIDTKVQVIKYEYDSIAEEYLKQELGQPKITMSDVLGKINSSINNMNKNINDAKTELSNTISNVKTNTAENLNNAISNFDNALNKVTKDSSTALEQAKEDLNNAILQYTGDKATTEALNLARTELANAITKVADDNNNALNSAKSELNDNITNSINNAKNEMTSNIDNAKTELYKAVTNLDGSKASIEQLNLAKENLNNAINTATIDKATKDELTQSKNELLEAIDNAIKDLVTKNVMDNAIKTVSDAITGYDGGYVRLNPPSNPSEILVMDNEDINQAQTVWRWNKEGLGVSRNGYNGTFYGLTKNGKLVIDSTTTNTLDANFIKTQVIESINTNSKYFHLGSDAVILGDTATGNYLKVTANGIENYYANQNFEYLCCVWSESFTLDMGCVNEGSNFTTRTVTKKVLYSSKLKTMLRGRKPLQVIIMERSKWRADDMPWDVSCVSDYNDVKNYDTEGITIEGRATWCQEQETAIGGSISTYYTGGSINLKLLVIA